MVIEDMLVYLAENRGDVDAVYINQINRFTRAGGDNYLYLRKRLFDLGVELIDAYGVIQETKNTLAHLGFSYDWSNRAPSRMAEVIMAEQAHAEASDILTRTVGQEINLVQNGYQVRVANIGYKNSKVIASDGKKRPIMTEDEIEGPWIKAIFEMRAEGQLADIDICDRVNAMGFKTRQFIRRDTKSRNVIGYGGGKPLTVKRLHTYITKPIYCGIRVEKWTHFEPIRTPFSGLVSIHTFNKANRGKVFIHDDKDGNLSIEKNYRHYRQSVQNQDFVLRHVILCPECNKPFMGSFSKNRLGNAFGYYHCDRNHKRYSVPKAVFESAVGYMLESLRLKPSYLAILKTAVLKVWQEKNSQAKVEVEAASDHSGNMRARQDFLIQKLEIVNSPIVIQRLEEEIESLQLEILNAGKHKAKFQVKEDQIMAYFDVAKSLLEHPDKIVKNGVNREKLEKLWRMMFVQHPTWDNIQSGTLPLSLPYKLKRNIESDQSELVGQARKFWNTLESDVKRFVDGV